MNTFIYTLPIIEAMCPYGWVVNILANCKSSEAGDRSTGQHTEPWNGCVGNVLDNVSTF